MIFLYCSKIFVPRSEGPPLTLSPQSQLLTTLKKQLFENILGKGENAGNQHFLLFPQCFLIYQEEKITILTSNFWSANTFNLVQPKLFSFGKQLRDHCSDTTRLLKST